MSGIEIDLDASSDSTDNKSGVVAFDADYVNAKRGKAKQRLQDKVEQSAEVAIDITSPALMESSTQPVEVVAADLIPNDRDLVNQLLGQIQMANSFARFADVVSLQKLKYIKDNKIYRSVAGVSMVSGVSGEKIADVGTWAGFCQALGLSVSKVDEDLLNLNAFGEEALKQLSSIGAGYRELRQYRKLPEDQKTALIEAAKTGDKEQLLELAETLIEKHIQEKAELNTKVTDLSNDLTQAGKRAKNMDAEIERQGLTIERLSKQQRVTSFDHLTEDIRLESMHLHAGAELSLMSLQALFDKACNETVPAERDLCVQQVYIALNAVVSRGALMIEAMKEQRPDLADRVQGQHVLSPEEAERWTLEFESVKNAHGAAEAARQIQRDQAKPRGRGRPSGSTNKAE